MTNSRLYTTWTSMKGRCGNPQNTRYERYGGRGIKVCDEWKSFEAFRDWALSSGYRDDLTIERINCNGDYEPSNCKWIPMAEQAKNTRASRRVTINGETRVIAEWARISGVDAATIRYRLNKGFPTEELLKRPIHKGKLSDADIERYLDDIGEGNRAPYGTEKGLHGKGNSEKTP